jgi:DNA-binding response OmpR family regulator
MSKKILLADDSVTIQKVISITFASEDYELIIVGDGDAAIKKAKDSTPDLVLADVAMPGKNGYEVSEALKNDPATAAIPVMLLAGTFEPLDKNEAARVKADDSIVKPFESQELLDKVRNLLAKSARAEAAPSEPAPVKAGPTPGGPGDIWEAGDFTGFTEEPEFKEHEAPDLSFLESGLFEETKELSSPHDDFTDLEFHEEDFKVKKESAPAPAPEQKPASHEPPTSDNFDIVEPFEFKAEEIKEDTFDIPSFEEPSKAPPAASETAKKPFWAETEREPEAVKAPEPDAEPDMLEVPQEELPEEALEFVEAAEEKTPFATPAKEAPAVSVAGVEKAVAKAAAGAVAKLEERFRSDIDSRLRGAEIAITRAIENTAAKVEASLKDGLGARLEKSVMVPKEEVAEIVRRVAKEVIEEVAWEVIPELAEELIKAEISRVKEAIIRAK